MRCIAAEGDPLKTTTELAGQARALGEVGRTLRARLFERVVERIHDYFVKLVWEEHAVDDCLQNTLLALETSLQNGRYDPSYSFNRWLWLQAHDVYVAWCRKRSRAPAPLAEEPAVTDPGCGRVEARLDAEAILERLRRALEAPVFEAFVLCRMQGFTSREVASLQTCTRRTVTNRLAQAEQVLGGIVEGRRRV